MLKIDRLDRIAVVTLNRPEALNALSRALRAALHEATADLASDPEVSVIILTGAGRAFTAGGACLSASPGSSGPPALRSCRSPETSWMRKRPVTGAW
jgi:enoyl-CoA hydratase/carnithine racemase